MDGQWQSSEGRIAQARVDEPGAFPPIADVLPQVHKRPYYETARQAEVRQKSNGQVESVHVVVGIDTALLNKVAEALGNPKLTLMVPVPIRPQGKPPQEMFVNKPVAVCPTNGEGRRGSAC